MKVTRNAAGMAVAALLTVPASAHAAGYDAAVLTADPLTVKLRVRVAVR